MNNVFSISIFFLLSFFVNAQTIDEVDFSLSMTPSSGGIVGYELLFKENNLYVLLKKLKIEDEKITLGETINNESIKLSKRRLSKINRYVNSIKDLKKLNSKSDLIYDAWVFDFFVKGNSVIKTNSTLIHDDLDLKKASKFLKYLLRISKVTMKRCRNPSWREHLKRWREHPPSIPRSAKSPDFEVSRLWT